MEELDLYKFLMENQIYMRWDDDVLSTWILHYHLDEFTKLISSSLNDGGRGVQLLSGGTIWIDLVPICEYYGIEPERIFPNSVPA